MIYDSNIIDNYVKNIASYKYTLNIDPNLIGQNEDSKHILKIKKTYTINSNWFTVNYQNNDTIIKIKDLFLNRSFYYDISDSYKLQINDTDYEIKIFSLYLIALILSIYALLHLWHFIVLL